MRFLPLLYLGIPLIAGCTVGALGKPPEQERHPTLVLNNSANETQTFMVWVVEVEI